MPKTPLTTTIWCTFICASFVFLGFALLTAGWVNGPRVDPLRVFGTYSATIFSMFSAIFAFLALSSRLAETAGRPLTLATSGVSLSLLLFAAVLLTVTDLQTDTASIPAVASALLMIQRAAGIALLPARGDRNGLKEAAGSVALATGAGSVWLAVDPPVFPAAFATALCLSWPGLLDGINAFADRVFHRAASAAGARNLAPGAFSAIARARHILVDKAAIMSGPDLMVSNVMAFNNEPRTLLAVAASAEACATHPVAHALRQLAVQWRVQLRTPDRYEPEPGLGAIALLGGQTVVIGSTDLLKRLQIDSFTADAIARALEADGKTVLRVAVGGRVVGVLGLEGTLRQDAGVAGRALRREGLEPWLHTNDSLKTREALADMLGMKTPENAVPGETAKDASARLFEPGRCLVLSLSGDRQALELFAMTPSARERDGELRRIAVSGSEDVGAFPALKFLASRRDLLALRARQTLMMLWAFCGLLGAAGLLSVPFAPLVSGAALAILLVYARLSVSGAFPARRRAQESQ
ncbi:MAG: HAD family hydrolase [Pseudomonadota bacterium]